MTPDDSTNFLVEFLLANKIRLIYGVAYLGYADVPNEVSYGRLATFQLCPSLSIRSDGEKLFSIY